MQICSSCGGELSDQFRFCGFCGFPLVSTPLVKDSRKTVTMVFCDLKGSTNLGEVLDSESLREMMSRYFDRMSDILEGHGGTVEKFIGDAIMAVFGLRKVHEDDALRAVRAAAEMRSALAEVNEEVARGWGVTLTNRLGVNTGEVIAGEPVRGQRLVIGDAVNVAARLEQAAPPNEVLIGPMTHQLVRDHVEVEPVEPLELKGKSERVPAYRLVSVARTEGPVRKRERPMVGRDAELAHLRGALGEAAAAGLVRMVTVLGQPGVGKSTLMAELREAAETTPPSSVDAAFRTDEASRSGHSSRSSRRRPTSARRIRPTRRSPSSRSSPVTTTRWSSASPRSSACPRRSSPWTKPSGAPASSSRAWRRGSHSSSCSRTSTGRSSRSWT